MLTRKHARALGFVLTFTVLIHAAFQTSAQELDQTFDLRPGWNSIYLEVELADPRLDLIFTNVPIASVWTWNARVSSADFVQQPDERLPNQEKWLVYYARSSPESRFNTLFALLPRRAYLIKLKGTNAVTLTVKGRPSLLQTEWAANAYNLRGFPADSQNPPTFKEFFQHSKAHFDKAQGRLQPIYRLDPAGRWEPVSADARVRRGEAYWVYTDGASTYAGPFSVAESSGTGVSGDGLDFGLELETLTLRFDNAADRAVVLSVRSRAPEIPLSYRVFPFYGSDLSWLAMPGELNFQVTAGGTDALAFGIRRSAFAEAHYGGLLEVSDSLGTLVYIPVSAEKFVGAAAAAPAGAGKAGVTRATAPNPVDYTGLWTGAATIRAVSEPHSGTLVTNQTSDGGLVVTRADISTQPTPTKSQFNLRLLVHVSSNGVARLLKEITLVSVPPVFTNDASGNRAVAEPGHAVLLTDPNLFACYSSSGLTGERPIGRRLSSIHFDFETTGIYARALTGAFRAGGSIQCALTNFPGSPTNPFRHKFHPDHDGLDANYQFPNDEVFAVVRQIALEFSASGASTPSVVDYNYNTLSGIYRESISGLHKDRIYCEGTFRLNRISLVGALDPPCPGVAPLAIANSNP